MGYDNRFNLSDIPECQKVTKVENERCHGILNCYHGTCLGSTNWWQPVCECEQGWQGNTCDTCCKLPCINNSTCQVNRVDSTLYCDCTNRYTGAYCHLLRNVTTPGIDGSSAISGIWNTYTVTIGSVLLVIVGTLILLTPVLMYILYKKRNILVLKVFYKLKKFEDDDSKMYDVFLSYRTSHKEDRDFVIYKLLKKIENCGFSACIDERDFIPGADIAGTIIEAIQQSRRTVIVVSPAYIKGEWPEFEVQCALTETLRKQHRIIPVIFKPITACQKEISPTLQHILDSITYIEWPQKEDDEKAITEFWRRIKLSLPKKRHNVNSENPTLPVTSDSDSGVICKLCLPCTILAARGRLCCNKPLV